jgi:hypothetical protein
LCCLIVTSQASAADKFKYSVVLRPATYSATPQGSVNVIGLDSTKTTTLRITAGGVPLAPIVYVAGSTSQSAGSLAFLGGDTIQVEQPSGTPQETFTIPKVSLAGSAGSPVVSGQAPDGTVAVARYRDICFGLASDDFTAQPQGGAFSLIFPKPLVAGSAISLLNYPGKGDRVQFDDIIPGETPCLQASAETYPTPSGEIPDPTPFSVRVSGLRGMVAVGARLVLRRAGAIVVDNSNAASTSSSSVDTAVQPLPGDVLELYRPHTAPTPSATFAIPAIAAVYDPGNSLVAVDAPAASAVETSAGIRNAMFSADRFAVNTPGGRTLLDFASAQGKDQPFSLARVDFISTEWYSLDGTRGYALNTVPGDLTAPAVTIRLDKKYKFSKIRSSLTARVTSSEAVTTKLTLTLPGKLKTSASKPKAPRVIATAKLTIGAGTTKVKIKLTKSGKRLIAKMRKERYPANKATLTLAASDFSGNAVTAIKTTKLARR